jgi:hypothetical protein
MALAIPTDNILQISPNPFQGEIFQSCWSEHLAGKYQVTERYGDFAIHSKKFAKGLLTVRELKFLASHTGWFQDFTSERVEALKSLSREVDWDYLYMVWAGSREKFQAFEYLKSCEYPMLQGWAKPMHIVDLQNGFEGYLASRNSKDRYNIRQKLKRAGHCELFTYDRFEDIDAFFEWFFDLHVPYWKSKTGYSFFADPAEQAFTAAWAKALYPTGKLRLHGLKLDGKIANLSFSFIDGDTLYWVLTINTGHQLEAFPGLVSLYLRMQEAATEGINTFNMAYGAMPYKLQVQTHTDSRNALIVINPKSIKGRLFQAYYRYKGFQPII